MIPTKPHQLTAAPDSGSNRDRAGWRRDFPIDWLEDHYLTRRNFTRFLLLMSFAFAFGHFWIVWRNLRRRWRHQPPMRRIAKLDQLAPGQSLVFAYPAEHDTCLLVRIDETNFVAFSQKCTHLSCPVVPEPGQGRFFCPCHNGSFDLKTGRPLAGPARRPLPRIELKFVKDVIYATGLEARTV
ncbi:MAG TPA: Rieske 2Fe-2S domain-containing protein [Blastocatellia bacterium]|nr:Rieske 2Fe-2S domain-containing protein [Blastocatellia bacterium]